MVSDVRPSSCERQGLGPVSGGADGIDTERRRAPAHLHAGPAQLDVGVDPNRQTRRAAEPFAIFAGLEMATNPVEVSGSSGQPRR